MLLSARMLNNVSSANTFDWADEVEFSQGDTIDVFFQLVDATLDKPVYGYQPGYRRYMPAAGATLSVTVANIDDDVAVTRTAVQPYPLDPSIWKVSVLGTDVIVGTCALKLSLNESGKVTTGILQSAVLIHSPGNC